MNAPTLPSFGAKPKMINGKIVWSSGPSMRQYFALPESIMYYMAMNPSSAEVYKKLIQSCKYFFEKNPILVAADIYGETTICSKKECDGYDDEGRCCVKIDLEKFSTKFWFTHAFYLDNTDKPNFTSMLCPKIYRCEAKILSLTDQNLMYDELQFLGSSVEHIGLRFCQITNADGSTVMLGEILGALPRYD
uniref:Uncharacterized protein n=1 Tax=Panagrolaimus sp. ES5 TaxID=591445 RepID=A0AC34FLJ4_9BILA